MRDLINLVENAQALNFISVADQALSDAGIPENVVVDLDDSPHGFFSEHPIVELAYLEVPEEERGQGIGTKVMKVLIQCADEMGVALALTASDEDNEDFYFQFGFSGGRKMIREPRKA